MAQFIFYALAGVGMVLTIITTIRKLTELKTVKKQNEILNKLLDKDE